MADRDTFIDEVSEELRRDRMLRLWRRWGPWIVGVIVLLVIAAGVASWLENQDEAEAREAGAALIAISEMDGARDRAEMYADMAAEREGGVALVARLSQAAALAEAGDADAAAAALEAVESDGSVAPVYRSLAGLKAAMLRAPSRTPEEREQALAPHLAEGQPFRLLALERRAVARLEAGNLEGARADIDAALADPMLSPTLRQRLEQLSLLTGGAEG